MKPDQCIGSAVAAAVEREWERKRKEEEGSWQEWFNRNGERHVKLFFYGESPSVNIEEMYQMFKARLSDECSLDSGDKK